MKTRDRSSLRAKRGMKIGGILPMRTLTNPFQGGGKYASAGATMINKGAGVFLKIRF